MSSPHPSLSSPTWSGISLPFPLLHAPVDRLDSLACEECVCLAEVPAAEKSPVGRQWAGVWGGENQVSAVWRHQGLFLDGETAPQQKHQVFPYLREPLDNGVGKGLPADSCVACGHVGPHRQGGVQEQDPLLGPAFQVPVGRGRNAQVVVEFLEDVDEGRRRVDSVGHREAEPVGLSRIVIRVLPDDDRLYLAHRAKVQGRKDFRSRRIHHMVFRLLLQESFLYFLEIGLLELVAQEF